MTGVPLDKVREVIKDGYRHPSNGGQSSKGYAALSALGQVFQPNMEMPDDENLAYQLLNELAESDNKL